MSAKLAMVDVIKFVLTLRDPFNVPATKGTGWEVMVPAVPVSRVLYNIFREPEC